VISDVMLSGAGPVRRDAVLTVGSMAETVSVNASVDMIQSDSASASGRRSTGSGRGLGSGAGSGQPGVAYKKLLVPPPPPPAMSVEAARARSEAAAAGQSIEDIYEYKLKEPITIRRNQSALVPIVQAPITVEKVSIWNDSTGLARPQRALWITNSTGVTLDGGSFTVLEEQTFAGEGIFDPIRGGEKRLVSYAVDLALNASSRNAREQTQITRIRVNHGVLSMERQQHEKKTYTFRNEDTAPRSVIVEHPVRAGYELRSEAKPTESTAAWMRFRVSVEPKQSATLVVDEARPIVSTAEVVNMDLKEVGIFVRDRVIDKDLEAAIGKIHAQKLVVAKLNEQKSDVESQVESIFDDQQRLRENMKALKGSAEEKALLHRYAQQLNEEENRLDTLKKDGERLEAERDKAQRELDRLIQDLTIN
jgi:hypothetical protein